MIPRNGLAWATLLIGVALFTACTPRALGVNMGNPKADAGGINYPMARLLDLTDIISINASVGFGIAAGAHVTQAVAVDLGTRSHWVRVGTDRYPRRYLLGTGQDLEIQFGPFALGFLNNATPLNTYAENYPALKRPTSGMFQDLRDYWSIGAMAFAGVAGAEVEIHPVQIADFFAGFAMIDFLRDDKYGAHDPPDRLDPR